MTPIPSILAQPLALRIGEVRDTMQNPRLKGTLANIAEQFDEKAAQRTLTPSDLKHHYQTLLHLPFELMALSEDDRRVVDLAGQIEDTMLYFKPTPAERITRHNAKALTVMSRRDIPDPAYPYAPNQKAEAKKYRRENSSFSNFQMPLNFTSSPQTPTIHHIHSQNTSLPSCMVNVSCTIGFESMMLDRYLAVPLTFEAHGKSFEADLFGVFDGFGKERAVLHVLYNLKDYIKCFLELQLQKKNRMEDAIFYALKEAIDRVHVETMRAENRDGTTAVFGFILKDSNQLYTASIGNSTAVLCRKGQALPMSIKQKPFAVLKEPDGEIEPDTLNEYAKQLLKRGVTVAQTLTPITPALRRGEKMVMTKLEKPPQSRRQDLILGIYPSIYFTMTRWIGSMTMDKWKKHTPEIFRQSIEEGDCLILHTHGVDIPPKVLAAILHNDKEQGCNIKETLECLVQRSTSSKQNVSAMSVTFDNTAFELATPSENSKK